MKYVVGSTIQNSKKIDLWYSQRPTASVKVKNFGDNFYAIAKLFLIQFLCRGTFAANQNFKNVLF